MILKGRVWKFGDAASSDYFISMQYDLLGRQGKFAELAGHILEEALPDFAKSVQKGDLIVAGRQFGRGKHLGGLVGAFKALGIGGVIAESFSAAWERVSINSGMPAIVSTEIQGLVESGDVLEMDLRRGEVANLTRHIRTPMNQVPEAILDILEAGGLEPYTLQQLAYKAAQSRNT